MVDFNKYLREAKRDPEFRDELLRGDANQVIKARFGDDLPYKVECEEEIAFKIKESDFESVAGGGGPLGQGYCSGPNGIYGSAPIPPGFIPVEEWEMDVQNKGYTLETMIFPKNIDKSSYSYSSYGRSGFRCVEDAPMIKVGKQWYVKKIAD